MGSEVKVVLDTNIIISALVFSSSQINWLREAWINKRILPVVDKACVEELMRALAYPKFRLSAEEIEILLGEYLPYTVTLEPGHKPARNIPKCKDPHDQKFLELAYTGNARFLVTGDKALLTLHRKTPFKILTPAEFRKHF
jgi:putative PIN family toxin of toxin-antitoxin system